MENVIKLKDYRKKKDVNEHVARQQIFLDAITHDKTENGIDWLAIFSDPKERQRFQMRLYQEAMKGIADDPDDTEYPDIELLLDQKD